MRSAVQDLELVESLNPLKVGEAKKALKHWVYKVKDLKLEIENKEAELKAWQDVAGAKSREIEKLKQQIRELSRQKGGYVKHNRDKQAKIESLQRELKDVYSKVNALQEIVTDHEAIKEEIKETRSKIMAAQSAQAANISTIVNFRSADLDDAIGNIPECVINKLQERLFQSNKAVIPE